MINFYLGDPVVYTNKVNYDLKVKTILCTKETKI